MVVSVLTDGATQESSPLPILGASSNMANKLAASATIEYLPNELLSNIFGYLDYPQPSASGLLNEPTFELTYAEVANLKAISLVSKRWRHIILPELFTHSRFIVHDPKAMPRPVLKDEIQPFLGFVRQNSLEKIVASFVLLVQDEKVANNLEGIYQVNGFASFWNLLFQCIDPAELLIVAPVEALGALTSCYVYLQDKWSFDCPYQYLRLQQPPIKKSTTTQESKSATNHAAPEQVTDNASKVIPSAEPVHNSSENLLRRPLDTISQIVQPVPQFEAPSSKPSLEDWQFPRAESSALFEIRPWSTLLLNEGSFVKAYSTYEFWSKQPPSVSSVVTYRCISDYMIDLGGASRRRRRVSSTTIHQSNNSRFLIYRNIPYGLALFFTHQTTSKIRSSLC
jgi:hypothetical protein